MQFAAEVDYQWQQIVGVNIILIIIIKVIMLLTW